MQITWLAGVPGSFTSMRNTGVELPLLWSLKMAAKTVTSAPSVDDLMAIDNTVVSTCDSLSRSTFTRAPRVRVVASPSSKHSLTRAAAASA